MLRAVVTAPALSIVIPAYNEQSRLPRTLERILMWIDESGINAEVLVSDDGSTDDTVKLAQEFAARSPRVRVLVAPANRGKGAAVRAGMLAAMGDLVLFSDADLSTPIEEAPALMAALQGGYQIAIGSRAHPESDIKVHQHPIRELMGRTFNTIVRSVVFRRMFHGIGDTQCGFKLFTREAAQALFGETKLDGFAFDVEVLWLAQGRFRVVEVPVEWQHVDDSKVSPGRDAAKMFIDILRIRRLHRGR